MSSTDLIRPAGDSDAQLLAEHGMTLLRLARECIARRIPTGAALVVDPLAFPLPLRAQRAAFVTLTQGGELRGCVGSPIAWRSLVEDVVDNAAAAAFEDHRFPPLREDELAMLEVSISLLSDPVPLSVDDESALLAQLRPGIDGLLMQEARRQALFLPQVWEQLPEPRAFLAHLKTKAGLPMDYWSRDMTFRRFTCTSIADQPAVASR